MRGLSGPPGVSKKQRTEMGVQNNSVGTLAVALCSVGTDTPPEKLADSTALQKARLMGLSGSTFGFFTQPHAFLEIFPVCVSDYLSARRAYGPTQASCCTLTLPNPCLLLNPFLGQTPGTVWRLTEQVTSGFPWPSGQMVNTSIFNAGAPHYPSTGGKPVFAHI